MLVRSTLRWQSRTLSHSYSTSLPPLPPLEEWKNHFPTLLHASRFFLTDQNLADGVAKSFIQSKNVCQEPKVIIEAFPGPGLLTRGLMKLPPSQVKKIIVLENVDNYLNYLKPLEECDPRVTVVPQDGFRWSTYKDIEALGLLEDVAEKKWRDAPPNLQFVSHITNSVHGDQLLSQFCRLIPEGNWLFKYGRVTLSMIMHKTLFERAIARPLSFKYCKLSVISKGTGEIEDLTPGGDPNAFTEHFYPKHKAQELKRGLAHTSGGPYCALNLYPSKDPVIQKAMLDKWDFCLRRLFVLKSTSLHKAINSLAPGANNLLPVIKKSVDTSKRVREMNLEDFAAVVKAFDEWPFAPEDLLITDALREVDREV